MVRSSLVNANAVKARYEGMNSSRSVREAGNLVAKSGLWPVCKLDQPIDHSSASEAITT